MTPRRRVEAGVVAAAAVLAVATILALVTAARKGDPPVLRPPDACDVLAADAVEAALGPGGGRLISVPRPHDPEGDRCNYEDEQTRKLVFYVRVESSENPAHARQLIQSLGGTPVEGVGEVARFNETPARSQMNAFAQGRWFFMTSVSTAVSQDKMAVLAREAIANASRSSGR